MQTPENENHRQYRPLLPSYGQHAASTPERPAKRQRLSLACNECRKRKVKCDAEMPRCKNCRIRGHVCETTDPKHPELVVVRKYGLHDLEEDIGQPQSAIQNTLQYSRSASVHDSDTEQHEQNPQNQPSSWIARSYRAHQVLKSPATTVNTRINEDAETPGHQPLQEANQTPDMTLHRDSNADRQKLMGGSSTQSLTMFLDLYLQKSGHPRIGPCFGYGMSFAEELAPSLNLELPDLPPSSLMQTYLQAFKRKIQPLYPILDLDQLIDGISRIRSLHDASWSPTSGFAGLRTILQASDVPILACIYAVCSLGADEVEGKVTAVGDTFLFAAYGLYAHLIGLPHLSSVQGLFLIMLGLRGRGREGQAFQVLGSAVRISHSIGLHRRIQTKQNLPLAATTDFERKRSELHTRIWWSCYAMEKLMELETTRPSCIPQGQHDQFLPTKSLSPASQIELKYFINWVSLAKILEQISSLLYRRKRGNQSSLEILQYISKIDSALRTWKGNLPEDIQPDGDMYCDDEERPFATFLALQYHQTVITLHRASLILPHNQFIEDIQAHIADLPQHQRLRNGEALCAASARATMRLCAQMNGRLQTPLYTLTQTLHGCIVLALSIMRQPSSRTVRSDLELLVTGTHIAEVEYAGLGQHPKFTETCGILRNAMKSFLGAQNGVVSLHGPDKSAATPGRNVTTSEATDGAEGMNSAMQAAEFQDPPFDPFAASEFDFTSIFESTALEDIWMVGTDVDMYSPLVPFQ